MNLKNHFKDSRMAEGPISADILIIDAAGKPVIRNILYFFALIFRYPTEAVYDEIRRHLKTFTLFFETYADTMPELPATQDLQAEYIQLFVNNQGFVPAVPYASCHLDGGLLMGDSLYRLRRIMAATGMELDPAIREPEDHLAFLLEMASRLLDAPTEYESLADHCRRTALAEILFGYITPVIKAVGENIHTHAQFDFYAAAISALGHFLADPEIFSHFTPSAGLGNPGKITGADS